MIQYSLTAASGDLVPCAQHICKEIASQSEGCGDVKVVFLLQLNRGIKGLVSYQSTWECVHIDEIRRSDLPTLINYIEKPISSLFDDNKEWLHIIKSTVQAAVEIVSKKSNMTSDTITKKINVLHKMLEVKDGKENTTTTNKHFMHTLTTVLTCLAVTNKISCFAGTVIFSNDFTFAEE